MDLYADNILDHFRSPRNTGELPDATIEHEEFNHACGDEVHLWLLLEKRGVTPSGVEAWDNASSLDSARDDNIVKEIRWTGTGCAISQASMSILSEELLGKSSEEIHALTKDDIYQMLGVPIGPRRFKCALMSLHTVKNALHKAAGGEPQSWTETVALE